MASGGTKICRRGGIDNAAAADEEVVDEFCSGFESRTASGAETKILDDAEVSVTKAQTLPQKKQF